MSYELLICSKDYFYLCNVVNVRLFWGYFSVCRRTLEAELIVTWPSVKSAIMPWNKLGRYYNKGNCGYNENDQMKVIKLYGEGLSYGEIKKNTGIHASTCFRIVKKFQQRSAGTEQLPRVKKNPKSVPEVIEFVEFSKTKKPSAFCREIRKDLLESNVCDLNTVPSRRTINHIVKETLGMTRKTLQQNPVEAQNNPQLFDNFMGETVAVSPKKMHFFDEASVIRTAGNRTHGHAPLGSRAIEYQKYASNATYTINLSCGYFGIDHFDVIEGPSNAFEMVSFFQEAIQETDRLGNPVYGHGDIIIMDNCGFHHHRLGSRILRNFLRRHGVQVVYQPPYSPELNVAEYVFHLMRNNLRDKTEFTYKFTELAVVDALQQIPDGVFPHLFSKCGYV